jgi:hypothetical protein
MQVEKISHFYCFYHSQRYVVAAALVLQENSETDQEKLLPNESMICKIDNQPVVGKSQNASIADSAQILNAFAKDRRKGLTADVRVDIFG